VNTEVRKMPRRRETRRYWNFSWLLRRWRRTVRRVYEAERANTSFEEISDMKQEQLKQKLRTAELKAEKLEKELYTERKLSEDERACMMKRIEQLEERENRILEIFTESEPESDYNDGVDPAEEEDVTEHASWYSSLDRELIESSWNPYWESQYSSEESLEGAGASSTTVPPAASMSDGSTERQSEKCPICLCGLVTQEVGAPEVCNHSFCADCLLEWLKTSNTCPVDRQVCDRILVRRCLGGEVVRRIEVEPSRQYEEDLLMYDIDLIEALLVD
jgi:PHD and RING finger domain-containing protein 1